MTDHSHAQELLGALRTVLPLGTEITAIDQSPELEAAWDRFMELILVDEHARRLLFTVKPFDVTYLFQVALDAAAGRPDGQRPSKSTPVRKENN